MSDTLTAPPPQQAKPAPPKPPAQTPPAGAGQDAGPPPPTLNPDDIFARIKSTQDSYRAQADNHLEAARAAEKKMQEAAPPPVQTSAAQQWGGWAMAIAAIGGLLTRTPITTAVNDMAGVLKGYHEGDKEQTEQQFQRWKVSHDAATKALELELHGYEAAMRQVAQAPREATAMLAANSAAMKNDYINHLVSTGHTEEAWQVVGGMRRLQTQMGTAAEKLEVAHQAIQAWDDANPNADKQTRLAAHMSFLKGDDPSTVKGGAAGQADADAKSVARDRFQKETGRAPTAEEESGPILSQYRIDARNSIAAQRKEAVEGVDKLNPDTVKLIAQQWLAGLPPSGFARTPANMKAISDEMARINSASDHPLNGEDLARKTAEFQGLKSAERTLSTREVNMEVPANEVRRMAPLALDASNAVDRGQYPRLNEIMQSAAKGSGDPKIVKFGLAVNSLIYSYSKFLNPTGIPTDADKAKATEILSTAWSKGQFNAAIEQIYKEIESGQGSIGDTRKELAGEKPPAMQMPAASSGGGAPTGGAPAGRTPSGGKASPEELRTLPHITDPAEAMKKPPGTRFIMPDGTVGVVPGGKGA